MCVFLPFPHVVLFMCQLYWKSFYYLIELGLLGHWTELYCVMDFQQVHIIWMNNVNEKAEENVFFMT